MYSTVYYDEREAAKNATPYCKEHGREVVAGLVDVLVDADEEAAAA